MRSDADEPIIVKENPCGFIMHRPSLKFVDSVNLPIKWDGEAIPDVDWEELLDDTLNQDHWEDMGR